MTSSSTFDPNEEMKKWPIYRVSVQKGKTDNMHVRDVQCENIMVLHNFLKRIYTVSQVSDFEFLEVHELLPQGRIALVHESRKEWPKGIKVEKYEGLIRPKIARNEVGTTPKSPEDKDRIKTLVEHLAGNAITIAPASMTPEEEGRPLFPYKREVA